VSPRHELETAIESHRSELKAYCSRTLGSPFDADDAVQETLVRAWRSVDGLHERASLRPWLYRIASNVCIDAVNRSARLPLPTDEWEALFSDTSGPDPAELVLTREDIRLALMAVMDRLPQRQRTVLLLRDVLCFRAAEVADVLSTSVAAVNSALQRAHATLDATPAGT
jgi:RNA polymerase sigma-70 factor (ECF subfamily)